MLSRLLLVLLLRCSLALCRRPLLSGLLRRQGLVLNRLLMLRSLCRRCRLVLSRWALRLRLSRRPRAGVRFRRRLVPLLLRTRRRLIYLLRRCGALRSWLLGLPLRARWRLVVRLCAGLWLVDPLAVYRTRNVLLRALSLCRTVRLVVGLWLTHPLTLLRTRRRSVVRRVSRACLSIRSRQGCLYGLRRVQVTGARRGYNSWASLVGRSKLRSIITRGLFVLTLDRSGIGMTPLFGSQLLLRGTGLHAVRASVVGNAIVAVVVYNGLVINVVNVRYIHVVDGAVVVELVALPAAAIISVTRIAVAVINAAVESHGRTPISGMPVIYSGRKTPVSRSPQESDLWRHYPGARNPVIIIDAGIPCPIARHPDIPWPRAERLGVHGQNRRSK